MTTYSYDATGRLTQRSYPTGNPVTFTYDALGRRTAMIDPSGRTTYTYDAAGRLTVQVAPGAKAITYAHDAVGNRATMVDPDGGTTTYAYDARNGLTSLVNPLQERTTWQYDAVGRVVTLTHGNGATAGYSYNAAGWVTSLVNAKSSAATITSHAYSYDAVGNPVGMTEANGDVLTWTYDALNQLTREQRSGDNAYDLTYSYDPVGNRLTKLTGGATTTYTYDAANELTLEDAAGALTTYAYDENGNTLVWNAAGSRTTLTWGYEDEVLTVEPAAGGIVTMTYDADHMRRKREEGASTAKYLWDGAQILMDLDGSDATVARYTLAPFGYGDLLSQRRGNATSFYHFDALGSTRALTESDEDISDTYLYDAWGVLKASTGSTTNPYRYVGKLGYLSEAALDGYLLRRRYYRQAGGRFVSVDPLRSRSGASDDPAYAYCEGRPAALVDPGGYAVDFRGCGPEKEASVNRWCERLRAIPQDEMNQISHCIDQHTRAHKIPSCYPFTESVANTFRRFCDRGRLTCESRGCGDCKPEQGEPICGAQDFGYNYCKISLCFPEVGSPNKCGNPFDPRIPPLEDAFLHELAHCAGIQGDGDRQDLCNEIHAKCLWRVLA